MCFCFHLKLSFIPGQLARLSFHLTQWDPVTSICCARMCVCVANSLHHCHSNSWVKAESDRWWFTASTHLKPHKVRVFGRSMCHLRATFCVCACTCMLHNIHTTHLPSFSTGRWQNIDTISWSHSFTLGRNTAAFVPPVAIWWLILWNFTTFVHQLLVFDSSYSLVEVKAHPSLLRAFLCCSAPSLYFS